MSPEEILSQLNMPNVTVVQWCSFCNSREANGTVKFDLAPGIPVDLYICTICVEQAKSEGFLESGLTDTDE
jgi:hypothetical protein